MRGEVWDANLAHAGRHPVVVLTANRFLRGMMSATAVLVTGTSGPRFTHIPLGEEAGLTGHPESYAVATELHDVPLAAFRRRRGRLDRSELDALSAAIRTTHGLEPESL